MRPPHHLIRVTAAGLALGLLATTITAVLAGHHTTPRTAAVPAPARPAPPRTRPAPPTDPHILGWTLYDLTTNTVTADHGTGQTNHAASTIKIWLAGDALRRAGTHPTITLLRLVDAAIIDSDNAAATALYLDGGGRSSLWRMTKTCNLTRTLPGRDGWGSTLTTAGDLALLAACTAHGTVAGPTWTPLLLNRMRVINGVGRFGPPTALPDHDVAAKNGWLLVAGQWHVNCTAIIDNHWTLGIITRYPAALGLAHGAQLCADLTSQLFPHAHTGGRRRVL